MSNSKKDFKFLSGSSEMQLLTQNFNWSATSLGPIEQWSTSLNSALGIVLHSAFPMFLFWGEDLICFYNDSFRPSLGAEGKHPAVGKKGREVWAEIWDFIGPLIQSVMTSGEPVSFEDQLVPFYRDGKIRDIYWTFSYSPVYDDNGKINGVFVTCTETTSKIITVKKLEESTQKLSDSEQNLKNIFAQAPVSMTLFLGPEFIIDVINSQALEQWGRTEKEALGKPVFDVLPEARNQGFREIMDRVYSTGKTYSAFGMPVTLNRNNRTETIYVNFTYEAYRDVSGKIAGVMSVSTEVTAEVMARKKIEEEKERANLAIDVAGLGLYEIDLEKNTVKADKRFNEIYGFEKTGSPGDYVAAMHPDDRPVLEKAQIQIYEKGWYNYEIRILHPDQSIHWIRSRGRLIRDDEHKPVKISGVVQDITDQVESRKILEKSEERFRTMAESSSVLIAISDETSNAVYFNRAWENLTGRSAEKLLNFGWADLIHEEDRQEFIDLYLEAFDKRKEWTGEFRILHKDGTYHWLLANGPPIFKPDGSFGGYISSCIDITEHKNIERRIRESENQVRSIIETAPFPIGVYVGKNMRIEFANQSILDVWGKGNDVIGKLYSDILPELTNQKIFAQLDEVYTSGVPFHARNQRVDLLMEGKMQPFYFNYSFTPLYDSGGQVYGVMNTAAEITDLNLAKLRVEQSEKNFRNMILQAPVAMCQLVGPTFIIEVANELMIELWGKPEKEVMNKPVFKALPDAREQGLEQLLTDVYNTGKTFEASELPVNLIRNGKPETVFQNFVYEAYRDTDGTILGVLAVTTDVTEQVLARQKVEESEEKAHLAINSADLGVYEILYETDEMITDDRFKEIWGVDRSVQRHEYAAAIHPADLTLRKAAHESSLATGHLDYQARLIWKDKSVRWVRITGKVLFDEKKNPFKLIGIIQDITAAMVARQKIEEVVSERTKELAEANKDLQKSNSELAQFAYIASHDLQEPLRKISTFTQMLESKIGDKIDPQSKNYLEKINNSSIRMNTLIRNVLSYSELVKDKEVFAQVDLNKVIEHALTDYELMIEQKGASVLFDALPTVEAIPLQMAQLFTNILGNSLKFSKKDLKPEIRITWSKLGDEEKKNTTLDPSLDYYKIRFSDNGIGLKPEYTQQIFNIFQRLHRKTEYEGTGIGLAMCKKIALNHGGDLNADGSSENGAVFNFILPVNQK